MADSLPIYINKILYKFTQGCKNFIILCLFFFILYSNKSPSSTYKISAKRSKKKNKYKKQD